MDVPLLRSLVIPTFANYPAHFGVESTTQQNTIMKFCFILGTVQLSLACVMNIRRKFREKDLSWLADLGWLAAIDALYFVVLYLVIGQQVNLLRAWSSRASCWWCCSAVCPRTRASARA